MKTAPLSLLLLPFVGATALEASATFDRQVAFEGAVVHSAQVADVNGDGLMDLIFSAMQGVNLALAPDFEVVQIHSLPPPYKDASIHSNLMDVDGDGDQDFLGCNQGVYWLECPDGPSQTKSWNLHWISKEFTGIHCITTHDVDEDGKADIVTNNFLPKDHKIGEPWLNEYPDSIIWFSVPRDPRDPSAWKPHLIADEDAGGGTHYLGFADLDGDGHDEALHGAKGDPFVGGNYFASWKRGSDVTKPWKKTVLPGGEYKGATHLYGSDFDGDGDVDLAGSQGHGEGIVLFEGPDLKPRRIDDQLDAPHSFAVADIEEDGDDDLFVCAKGSRRAEWFENDGKGNFTRHLLSDDQEAYDIVIADLEDDGDLDVVIAGQQSKNIVFFRQK